MRGIVISIADDLPLMVSSARVSAVKLTTPATPSRSYNFVYRQLFYVMNNQL